MPAAVTMGLPLIRLMLWNGSLAVTLLRPIPPADCIWLIIWLALGPQALRLQGLMGIQELFRAAESYQRAFMEMFQE